MENCIFCQIINKTASSDIEYENDIVIAIKNINPVADTHILLIPKVHINSFMDLTDSNIQNEMFKVAQILIKEKKIENAYKMVFNGGKYQKVMHLHWHLLGGNFKSGEL